MEELNANMLDIINAYNEGDDEMKKSLVNLFGKDIGKYDYHDIKTFEDACNKLNIPSTELNNHNGGVLIESFRQAQALYKLLIIQKAINNGVCHDKKGWCYYPYWELYSDKHIKRIGGLSRLGIDVEEIESCSSMISENIKAVKFQSVGNHMEGSETGFAFPICYNSEAAALYAGRQFKSLFFEYYGIFKTCMPQYTKKKDDGINISDMLMKLD